MPIRELSIKKINHEPVIKNVISQNSLTNVRSNLSGNDLNQRVKSN